MFNEGYVASSGDALVRTELCLEAIRLARHLAELMPDEPEVLGLLALLLLTESRRAARTDADGSLVRLPDQDRSLWDSALIEEGQAIVRELLRRNTPGPYQIQAAIAAVHSDANGADDTAVGPDRGALRPALRVRADAGRRPQPRHRHRRAPAAPKPAWRSSTTSTSRSTTCSPPPAPTSSSASAAPTKPPPPTSRRWPSPRTKPSATSSTAAAQELLAAVKQRSDQVNGTGWPDTASTCLTSAGHRGPIRVGAGAAIDHDGWRAPRRTGAASSPRSCSVHRRSTR